MDKITDYSRSNNDTEKPSGRKIYIIGKNTKKQY